MDHGVGVADFNQYGTRRGNHEVMMRGTFANIRHAQPHARTERARRRLHLPLPVTRGSLDLRRGHAVQGRRHVPLVIFAGVEYGNGSSRDWAAKGTNLLGVRAVIAQSFERIHRSNLVGMGVIPFVFEEGTTWESLGLKGDEMVSIEGLADIKPREKKIAKVTYLRRNR
jgi:aconitate hydratase